MIAIRKGERIQLVVQSSDATHGFAIPQLRINEHVDAGKSVIIDIPTDVAGTFEFVCSVPCGEGHAQMRGMIVIEE